jgi:hypothetical protein
MRPRGNTQEDYLLRMIRQAAELLRQLRRRLLRSEQSAETIRHDAAAAIDLLLGAQATVLDVVDPVSAVQLVGHPAIVGLWTALLDVEGDASEASGDATVAMQRRGRAEALRDAARRVWGDTDAGPIDAETLALLEQPES